MIRVFDTLVNEKTMRLERYGVTYKRVNVSRKGQIQFFTFDAPGMESLVVVPYYFQQYRTLEKEIAAVPKGKSVTAYTQLIRTKYDSKARPETFYGDDGEEKAMLVARYKDIEVEFLCGEKRLSLSRRFTIRENNILGENVVVDLQEEI